MIVFYIKYNYPLKIVDYKGPGSLLVDSPSFFSPSLSPLPLPFFLLFLVLHFFPQHFRYVSNTTELAVFLHFV